MAYLSMPMRAGRKCACSMCTRASVVCSPQNQQKQTSCRRLRSQSLRACCTSTSAAVVSRANVCAALTYSFHTETRASTDARSASCSAASLAAVHTAESRGTSSVGGAAAIVCLTAAALAGFDVAFAAARAQGLSPENFHCGSSFCWEGCCCCCC